MRAFITLAVIIVGLTVPMSVGADEKKAGTVKITVLGVDGKPSQSAETKRYEVGPDGQSKGQVVLITTGTDTERGATAVFVPDGKEVSVTIKMGPRGNADTDLDRAEKAAKAGNLEEYNRALASAKTELDLQDKSTNELETAVNTWADENNLPRMTVKQVDKQLKLAEKPGVPKDDESIARLKSYREKLQTIVNLREYTAEDKKRANDMKPPEAKKAAMLPSTCPEGQSGGLLAGLINSVTGTNSIEGICGEEPEKDHKDRGGHGTEHHGGD